MSVVIRSDCDSCPTCLVCWRWRAWFLTWSGVRVPITAEMAFQLPAPSICCRNANTAACPVPVRTYVGRHHQSQVRPWLPTMPCRRSCSSSAVQRMLCDAGLTAWRFAAAAASRSSVSPGEPTDHAPHADGQPGQPGRPLPADEASRRTINVEVARPCEPGPALVGLALAAHGPIASVPLARCVRGVAPLRSLRHLP